MPRLPSARLLPTSVARMADSFPGSPDSGGASFPQGSDATAQNDPGALPPDREVVLFQRYRVIRELGTVAANVVARAIARGVYEATALPFPDALPAWKDRFGRSQDRIRSRPNTSP